MFKSHISSSAAQMIQSTLAMVHYDQIREQKIRIGSEETQEINTGT